ncbi:zinc finger BED domain-containing protein 4-like [Cyprinodon tularosa]|uniref:zinc finger BED domain-containing protein 4-like n=1 Tax=Cyprinodon tularosa TaxID=77115 RepID=UPI0018E23299|nr:zinc finger BED domain-containing protein 4-like [Cyprinodon tularosa]
MLSQRSISDVVAVAKKIVGHFKHSQLACSRLEDVQNELGMPIKRLQQDVSKQWNSTFYMMQSLVEQKRALGTYAADFDLPVTLTANQWGIHENMITLLAPFEQLTREISSAQASVSEVIPAVMALIRLLSKQVSQTEVCRQPKVLCWKLSVLALMVCKEKHFYAVATMLDARFKDSYFDREMKEGAHNLLLSAINEMGHSVRDGSEHGDASRDDLPLKKKA